jgi:tetrapyrrole methylase family protein/MazG family protein
MPTRRRCAPAESSQSNRSDPANGHWYAPAVTDRVQIHIVGLGPGDPTHVTVETRSVLGAGFPIILRTRHHPSVDVLAPGSTDCDDLYRSGASFDAVYDAVVLRVLQQAETGPVVFAVPGSP